MRLGIIIVCSGAVVFMLRFAAALLGELRSLASQSPEIYSGKLIRSREQGKLFVMNATNLVSNARKSAGAQINVSF
jgi:hypothetical protein